MAKPSRYDKQYVEAKRQKLKDVRDNPGAENSVPQLRARVEQLEQALGLRAIP